MNIEYVYHSDHAVGSAHTNQIIHTCNGLARIGHNITLVSAGNLDRYVTDHGLKVEFGIRESVSSSGFDTPRPFYYSAALLESRSHDVIYTRDISFLKFLTLLPGSLVPPIVYEAHKSYAVVDGMDPGEECERLAEASSVVAISNGIREDIESMGGTVDAVIRDAANTELVPTMSKAALRSDLGLQTEGPVYVYAGSLNRDKYDLESVISAIGTSDQHQQLSVLGGEPAHVERLRGHVRAIGVEDQVQFYGRVPHVDVFKYLKASDVGIVAQEATDIRARKYTSPMKLFEYLASGLMVVATDVPAISEIAVDEPRILLYEPGNIDDIRETLELAAVESSSDDERGPYRYSYERRAREITQVLTSATE